MELLRHRSVRFNQYAALHARDKRSFQRDLQQLRAVGTTAGFNISKIQDGDLVRLTGFDASLRRLDDARPPLLRLLAELARTLGEPIQGEIGAIVDSAPDGEVFLHVHAPQLAEGSRVFNVYKKLKEAWSSPAGRASVQFRYGANTAVAEERTVDPYRVIVRSGRYYLVGFDAKRRAWRLFALDVIIGLPVKAGTVRVERQIPEEYANPDVLGFIKGAGRATDVTVEFSAKVAASATSRIWKRGQRVETLSGGRAQLTIPAADSGEVIRWAFGFGADARVVSPPAAVRAARDLAVELLKVHELDS